MAEKTDTYDCETYIGDTEYEMHITLYAKGRLLDYILKKSKKALAKKKGIQVNTENINQIDQFEIPKEYYNVIKVALSKRVCRQGSILQIESRSMRNCGKIALNHYVREAKFIRDNKDWKILVILNGLYSNTI